MQRGQSQQSRSPSGFRPESPRSKSAGRVWLDDERPAPEGWAHVETARDAIALLERGGVVELSLDHDLGDDAALGTGYDVASWLERAAFEGRVARLRWSIHSANPVGRARMERALQNADRFWARREG